MALGTLHSFAGFGAHALILLTQQFSHQDRCQGPLPGSDPDSQADLGQVPRHCCGQASAYNSNVALSSKSAPSTYSESELLISVTRNPLFFLSPISLTELTQQVNGMLILDHI